MVISICLVALLPVSVSAAELKTRLSCVEFAHVEQLQQFNRNIRLSLSNTLGRSRKQLSIDAEVSHKVDLIYGRVQEILDMHPLHSDLRIVLLPSESAVQQSYHRRYAHQVGYIAYFSPEENRIYIAVDKVNSRVLAHELAHVVIHHFFQRRPPERIHEILAQYVERQFKTPQPSNLK